MAPANVIDRTHVVAAKGADTLVVRFQGCRGFQVTFPDFNGGIVTAADKRVSGFVKGDAPYG